MEKESISQWWKCQRSNSVLCSIHIQKFGAVESTEVSSKGNMYDFSVDSNATDKFYIKSI